MGLASILSHGMFSLRFSFISLSSYFSSNPALDVRFSALLTLSQRKLDWAIILEEIQKKDVERAKAGNCSRKRNTRFSQLLLLTPTYRRCHTFPIIITIHACHSAQYGVKLPHNIWLLRSRKWPPKRSLWTLLLRCDRYPLLEAWSLGRPRDPRLRPVNEDSGKSTEEKKTVDLRFRIF